MTHAIFQGYKPKRRSTKSDWVSPLTLLLLEESVDPELRGYSSLEVVCDDNQESILAGLSPGELVDVEYRLRTRTFQGRAQHTPVLVAITSLREYSLPRLTAVGG